MVNPAFMHRCLALAEEGRGRVGNGALVGAVLVRNGTVIAEGLHAGFGADHAERDLLTRFTGHVLPTDVLYVNLEPCCHQGKTPPCTNLLIEKNIKTVVYGMIDPDRRISGKGLEELRKAGIEAIGPIERAFCEYLNRGFTNVRSRNRPWITLKKAVDPEGRIACDDGAPLKITSSEQDAWSHQFLRGRHDAILVGVGTIISDNPLLNIRFDHKSNNSLPLGLNESFLESKNSFQPYKIILDSECRIPADARVISSDPARAIVCVSAEGKAGERKKIRELEARGVHVVTVGDDAGDFVWEDLWQKLVTPDGNYHGLTSILVEGGAKTWQAFRDAGVVDAEVTLTTSPGSAAPKRTDSRSPGR